MTSTRAGTLNGRDLLFPWFPAVRLAIIKNRLRSRRWTTNTSLTFACIKSCDDFMNKRKNSRVNSEKSAKLEMKLILLTSSLFAQKLHAHANRWMLNFTSFRGGEESNQSTYPSWVDRWSHSRQKRKQSVIKVIYKAEWHEMENLS